MNRTFTRLIALCAGLYAGACGLFFLLLLQTGASQTIWWGAIGFTAATAVVLGVCVWAMRREMTGILSALSRMLQSFLDRKQPQRLFATQDDLLSKIQEQLLKLARMMEMQQQRYKQDGDEVKALISDIAHQLKTPHANLTLYAGLLGDPDLDAQQRQQFIRIVQQQADKLTWLLESLIKMSRLESGVIVIRKTSRSLTNTVLTAIKQWYPSAEAKGIELELDGEHNIELLHDEKWTAEAIGNVLDNAIKYTARGGSVRVTCTRYELFARIDVADTGIGIAEHEWHDIFKRFYRSPEAAHVEGVGIGLYLTRKLVMEQGGYVKVVSERGKGTVFSLFLPLESEGPDALSSFYSDMNERGAL